MVDEVRDSMRDPRRYFQVGVIGDSDASQAACDAAEGIGRFLARQGFALITGGHGGVMEAAARGAATHGGLTIGIVPAADGRAANPWCRVVLPTGLGHARNILTALAGDVVVALGGGAGTLSELAFAWMHGRPIFTLAGHDGWTERLGEEPIDRRASSTLVRCASISELEEALLDAARRA
jgi:uncharacterized protein (TIGR00725 family)